MTQTNESTGGLKRVLGLKDLVFYGIVLNQPVAAIGLFGLVSQISKGHMVFTLLLSMAAMLLTAVSYGRMAALYPSAGSAYAYVGRGVNPYAGFMAGWTMFLCYLIIPMINTVFGVLSFMRLFPGTPYWLGVVVFVAIVTGLNLMGVRNSMRANKIMLWFMLIIIGAFIVTAIRYIFQTLGWGGLLDARAIYNPATFNFGAIASGTALVALTYVGFDGITTLAEEVKNPKRNVMLAILIVCLFTGLFSALQMYLAQQSALTMWVSGADAGTPWYDRIPQQNIETSFMTVCAQVGGQLLLSAISLTMFVACIASAIAGQMGAARLLYGMGRDNVLPKKVFAKLDGNNGTPINNLLIVGVLAVLGSLLLNYQKVAELINFAALLAFMGVNLAAINKFYFQKASGRRNVVTDFLVPAGGFAFCLWIWWSLPLAPMIIGGTWIAAGLLYLAVMTRGFRRKPVQMDFSES